MRLDAGRQMEAKRCKMKEGCLRESKHKGLWCWRAAELTDRDKTETKEHEGEEECEVALPYNCWA